MNPKEAAQLTLDRIWGNRGVPVDPVWIAKKLGIRVIETKLPDEISGGLIKEKEKDPVIVISKTDSLNRKRFSCAHELGHYVKRVESGEESYEYVDLRNNLSSSGSDVEEIFANQFAACLLMPEDQVKEYYKMKLPSIFLAEHFGVSDDAMHFRLKNLNLL